MTTAQFPPLLDLSVRAFLERLAASQPAPGGGSAAALGGAMAAALVEMVTAVTLARKQAGDVRSEPAGLHETAARLRDRLVALVDEDAAAYARLRSAYRLPRASEGERSARHEAIQGAVFGALAAPISVAELCLDVLDCAGRAAATGSRLVVPDALMSGLIAHAALLGSVENARANLDELHDDEARERILAHLDQLASEAGARLAAVRAAAGTRS